MGKAAFAPSRAFLGFAQILPAVYVDLQCKTSICAKEDQMKEKELAFRLKHDEQPR
ncbi:MAG: hypothetical protein IT269_13350 [Saprospiraceae bacterium]|nr:hypothetical protein [Saprospiraceae bacterium]